MDVTVAEAPEAGALILRVSPGMILTDADARASLLDQIDALIAGFEPDVTTKKGREAIASLAHKIARTKTAIDEAGQAMNAEKRAQINAVDAERRAIREALDTRKAKVREPLDAWIEADEARVARARKTIDALHQAAVILAEDTSASVRTRLQVAEATEITDADFGDLAQAGTAARDSAIATLQAAVVRLEQQEKDAAELAQLREAEAGRQREEAERQAEAQRVAEEAAQRERIEREKAEAAERARLAAEQKAADDADRRQREHDAEIARVQREADAKVERERREAAAAEERRRMAEETARRMAEQEAAEVAAAAERKAANARHRGAIMGGAKADLMQVCELDEPTAKRIVLAIVEGQIRHTSIKFGG